MLYSPENRIGGNREKNNIIRKRTRIATIFYSLLTGYRPRRFFRERARRETGKTRVILKTVVPTAARPSSAAGAENGPAWPLSVRPRDRGTARGGAPAAEQAHGGAPAAAEVYISRRVPGKVAAAGTRVVPAGVRLTPITVYGACKFFL